MTISFNRKKKRMRLVKKAEGNRMITKLVQKRLSEYLEDLKTEILDPDISSKSKNNISKKYEKVSNLLKKPVLESKTI